VNVKRGQTLEVKAEANFMRPRPKPLEAKRRSNKTIKLGYTS